MRCMTDARDDPDIGVIVLTGSSLLHAASSSLKRPINVLVELFSMAVTQTQQMQVCKALHLHLLHRGAGLPPDNALSWPTVPSIGPLTHTALQVLEHRLSAVAGIRALEERAAT